MTASSADEAGPVVPGQEGWLGKVLAAVPRVLASKVHILWLFVLLLWIVVLAVPFPHIASARVELILGNYTNVTSDIGAAIAAGGTVSLVRHARRQSRLNAERHKMLEETHRMLRLAFPQHAAAVAERDELS